MHASKNEAGSVSDSLPSPEQTQGPSGTKQQAKACAPINLLPGIHCVAKSPEYAELKSITHQQPPILEAPSDAPHNLRLHPDNERSAVAVAFAVAAAEG